LLILDKLHLINKEIDPAFAHSLAYKSYAHTTVDQYSRSIVQKNFTK